MGKLDQNNQNSRTTLKQAKQLGKCHSSPTKESNKLEKINSKIEKQAKRNLNEIDSFDNLFDASSNFLTDLCFEQSVKNFQHDNEISGWQDTEASKRSITQERNSRLEKTSFNFNSVNNNDIKTQRAASANFSAGQTPLFSRRKIIKYSGNNGNLNQMRNDIDIDTLIFTSEKADQKNNSLNSPQVLLSNIIGQNSRFSQTPKETTSYPVVSQFDININTKNQKDNKHPVQQNQANLKRNGNEIFSYTLNEWKSYLDRYDSSKDLYNVNLNKKLLSTLQTFTTQNDDDNFGENDIDQDLMSCNNFLQHFNKKENFKSKTKDKNLSIDISSIRINQNNLPQTDEKKQIQNSPNHLVQLQNQGLSMNQSQYEKMNHSQRYSYRSTKSSQASRLFGRKKKMMGNTSQIHKNTTQSIIQPQQQTNKNGITEIRQRAMSYSLTNNNENVIKSSSSLSTKINIEKNDNNINNQPFNENNNSQPIISNQSSQKELKLNQIVGNTQPQPTEQCSSINQQVSSSYQPDELITLKNTQAHFVFSSQNTSPSNQSLENQDIQDVYNMLIKKQNFEKEQANRNQSFILKPATSTYHPKRSQNYSYGNAFQQISKEKVKQVIQQKNNQIGFRQVNNHRNTVGTQSLNSSINQEQNNISQKINQNNNGRDVLCDAGNFKIIRNKDSNKDNYIVKNIETNERLIIHIPNRNQTQQKFDETSLFDIKRTRTNSIVNIQECNDQKEQTFNNKKQLININQVKQQLKPTIQNIVADENNIINSKRINSHPKNSYIKKISEKLTSINSINLHQQDNKISKNNVVMFPNLLTSKN